MVKKKLNGSASTVISSRLSNKIIKNNSKQRGKIIIEGLRILKTELERFRFKPPNSNFRYYQSAHTEAIKKLKQVDYKPFAVVGPKGSIKLRKGHDIDIVFLPAKGITSGVFLAAVSEFTVIFKKAYKRKTKKRVICFPFSAFQEEVEFLSKRKDTELFLQFIAPCEHFYGKNIQNPAGIKTWTPDHIIYKSKAKIIKDIPETKLDRLYLGLNTARIFGAEYPKELVNTKMHSLDYLAKKIGVKPKKIKNALIYYQQLCFLMDYFNK